MSIADIINGTGAAGSASQGSGVKKKDQLGQAEFLELMIAQLKNQDPFKAMDPSQFLGQLAQFGTVSRHLGDERGVRHAVGRDAFVAGARRRDHGRPRSARAERRSDAAGGRVGEGRDRRADRHERPAGQHSRRQRRARAAHDAADHQRLAGIFVGRRRRQRHARRSRRVHLRSGRQRGRQVRLAGNAHGRPREQRDDRRGHRTHTEYQQSRLALARATCAASCNFNRRLPCHFVLP